MSQASRNDEGRAAAQPWMDFGNEDLAGAAMAFEGDAGAPRRAYADAVRAMEHFLLAAIRFTYCARGVPPPSPRGQDLPALVRWLPPKSQQGLLNMLGQEGQEMLGDAARRYAACLHPDGDGWSADRPLQPANWRVAKRALRLAEGIRDWAQAEMAPAPSSKPLPSP